MTDTHQNLLDAILRDPSRFASDADWRGSLPREVQDAVFARLRMSKVPAKIFNAFVEGKL